MPWNSASPSPSRPSVPCTRPMSEGVRLGIQGESRVTAEATAMRDRLLALGQPLRGFTVQEMAEGVEMLVGITHDDVFGPIVACGAGGTIAKLL
jgi:acyl-CoA synthetase (NDP forming)